MLNGWLTRERLIPAGVMAFMLVAFLSLSLHFDGRWWKAHHARGTEAGLATHGPVEAARAVAPITVTAHRSSVRSLPRTVATLSSKTALPLPGPLHWDVIASKTWNGVEDTLPEPKPVVHPPVVEKNPKRPFRNLSVQETRRVMREIAEAEARSREEALAADPAYGPRFALIMQKDLVAYRQAIAESHELSDEQMSAIYRQMIESPRRQGAAAPHLTNILP